MRGPNEQDDPAMDADLENDPPDGKTQIEYEDRDAAEYVGDRDDGAYVLAGERDGEWFNNVWVDCDSAGFTDDLSTDNGPYPTREAALRGGLNEATDWCLTNSVEYELTDAQRKLLEGTNE